MPRNETWFISDTHFSHKNVLTFDRTDGNGKLRPHWDDIEDMNDELVYNWNGLVRPNDTIYHLGDIALSRTGTAVLNRCNGNKILIRGNHDIYNFSDYAEYFDDVLSMHVHRDKETEKKVIFTHIPIHPTSMNRWDLNVHGHLHDDVVMKENQPDERYMCVSVENTHYCPVHLNEVLSRIPKNDKNI